MRNLYKELCDEFFAKYLETAWREKLDGEKITDYRVQCNADDREMPEGSKSAGKGAGAGLGNYVPGSRTSKSPKRTGKKLGRPRKKK
jgi:hypothetical protein